MEVEAGNVALWFVGFFVGTDKITAEKRELFRGLVEGVNRKTLGALLRSIKSFANFDDSILQIVDEALERRNYLMHRFFPSHNLAIFDEAGQRKMIEELKTIQAKLDQRNRSRLRARRSQPRRLRAFHALALEQVSAAGGRLRLGPAVPKPESRFAERAASSAAGPSQARQRESLSGKIRGMAEVVPR